MSIRHLATRHGIPESTIRSRAKAEGWQRDLTDDVRAATRAKLSRTSRSKIAQGEDAQIIEQASNDAAAIVIEHRQTVARWRGITERLAAILEGIEVTEDNFDQFARTLNTGVDAFGKVMRMERHAYRLDEERSSAPGRSIEELMAELAEAESSVEQHYVDTGEPVGVR